MFTLPISWSANYLSRHILVISSEIHFHLSSSTFLYDLGFEILTAVTLKTTVFWIGKPCISENASFSWTPTSVCPIFGLLFDPENDCDIVLRNFGLTRNYTLRPRWRCSSLPCDVLGQKWSCCFKTELSSSSDMYLVHRLAFSFPSSSYSCFSSFSALSQRMLQNCGY